MTLSVLLDACVLVPHPLFDTLLRVADAGLFRPLWSDEILVEVERTLTVKRGLDPQKARRRIDQMSRAFPDSLVEDHHDLISTMTNDPKDRHVTAAAVRSGANLIVTANLKDFPARSLRRYEIEAVHPDDFLLDQLDLDMESVLGCLRQQRADYTNPTMKVAEFFATFIPTVPRFAHAAESREREVMHEVTAGAIRSSASPLPLTMDAGDSGNVPTARSAPGQR